MIVGWPVLNAGLARSDLGGQEQQMMDLHAAANLKHKAAEGLSGKRGRPYS
jgi:hypothetical protein